MLKNIQSRLARQWDTMAKLGPLNWLRYREISLRAKYNPTSHRVWLGADGLRHPVAVRTQSSDKHVFHQIFIEREYSCLGDLPNTRLVVDCGANVGYSSAYFLSKYPECEVIAIEPDPENFRMLRDNLAPYGSRARPIHSGVWSHQTHLMISDQKYRDGAEWSRQVRECGPDEPGGFPAVDIGKILDESGHERISILKIDIEGTESVIFRGSHESWIDRVDTLVIELHDDTDFGRASDIFAPAIEGRGFALSHYGELTVCKREPQVAGAKAGR